MDIEWNISSFRRYAIIKCVEGVKWASTALSDQLWSLYLLCLLYVNCKDCSFYSMSLLLYLLVLCVSVSKKFIIFILIISRFITLVGYLQDAHVNSENHQPSNPDAFLVGVSAWNIYIINQAGVELIGDSHLILPCCCTLKLTLFPSIYWPLYFICRSILLSFIYFITSYLLNFGTRNRQITSALDKLEILLGNGFTA